MANNGGDALLVGILGALVGGGIAASNAKQEIENAQRKYLDLVGRATALERELGATRASLNETQNALTASQERNARLVEKNQTLEQELRDLRRECKRVSDDATKCQRSPRTAEI